jgi:DnaJ-class molecular chaperone
MASWSDALQDAEREMWDTIVDGEQMLPAAVHNSEADSGWAPIKAVPEGNVECDGCRGDGVHYGRGAVVNGKFVGFTGVCFRCGGKGSQTESDVKRNRCYDRHRTFSL